MSDKTKRMPPAVIRRLTRYLTQVQDMRGDGLEWVSSQELAANLGLTSSTVRQDLSHLDFSGISKKGYQTEGLESVLAVTLGADMSWRVVVVGAGNLGRAIALHEEFSRRDFNICGVFDADSAKVGSKIGDIDVLGMDRLCETVSACDVDMGIIAVPAAAAQGVADRLVMAGVHGLHML